MGKTAEQLFDKSIHNWVQLGETFCSNTQVNKTKGDVET